MPDGAARIASASVGVLLAVITMSGAAQDTIDVERLVTRFLATTDEYEKAFQNLVAEETKTIEVFDNAGKMEKPATCGPARLSVARRWARRQRCGDVSRRRQPSRPPRARSGAHAASERWRRPESHRPQTSQHEFHRHFAGQSIGGSVTA